MHYALKLSTLVIMFCKKRKKNYNQTYWNCMQKLVTSSIGFVLALIPKILISDFTHCKIVSVGKCLNCFRDIYDTK